MSAPKISKKQPREKVLLGLAWALTFASMVIVFDQLTKWQVRQQLAVEGRTHLFGPISLHHIENNGLAFGFFAGLPKQALGLVLVIIFVLLFISLSRSAFSLAATGLVVSGAISNLLDRFLRGSVEDYIQIKAFPVFNFADVAIVVGIIALCLELVINLWRYPTIEDIK